MDGKVLNALNLSRRHMIIGSMFLATAAVAEVRRPRIVYPAVDKEDFADWVPDVVGTWRYAGIDDVVLPPPDELSDRLYDNLMTRVYRNDSGAEVMLLLAYNNRQDGMLQLHRPETCYPTGGYELTDTSPTTFELQGKQIPASQFTATSATRREHVMFYTRVGEAYPRTWAQQRAAVASANLRGEIPDGLMVRTSSLVPDLATAATSMKNFLSVFYASAAVPLRKLLVENV